MNKPVNEMTYEERVARFNAEVAAGTIVLGAVQIACGGKLHPAMMVMDDPRHPKGRLQIRCSCAGTNNGSAYNRATWYAGKEKTCGRKR